MADGNDPRAVLEERLATLTGREAAISKHLRGEDGRHEADFGDRANYTAADEVLEGLEDAALDEIRAIRGALSRLDDGTYGTCVTCGDAIAPRRLEVMPHASQCTDCASQAG